MNFRRTIISFIFIWSVASVSSPRAQDKSRLNAPLPGIWKSTGADLLVIKDGQYSTHFITAISCVETQRGDQKDASRLFPQIESWTQEQIKVSGYDWAEIYSRLGTLPPQCEKTSNPGDPRFNFDVFWHYFAENYPSFAQRSLDWQSIKTQYGTRITDKTSDDELFKLLGEIVEKIDDPHVFLTNGRQGPENRSVGSPEPHGLAAALRRSNPGKTTREYRSDARKVEDAIVTGIQFELLQGKFKTAHNDRLLWGMMNGPVGFLRISLSVGLFNPGTTREQMYEQLDATLDTVFTDLRHAKALVIDVTTNTGGAGFVTDAVARRVIRKEVIAYQSAAKTATGEGVPFIQKLRPVQGPNFRGPVVVLVSGNTVSAGEGLPLVLRGLDSVMIYGEKTLGAISSFTMFQLPNGWRVAIPNYIVKDRDGRSFEGQGLEPDIKAVIFDPQRPVSSYFEAVRTAASRALQSRK